MHLCTLQTNAVILQFLQIKYMSHLPDNKALIGISCGDLNGIGPEIIIKTLSDTRLLDFFTPVIFANNKVINFYRKGLSDYNFSFSAIKDSSKINSKQVNIYNCWEEDVNITPGQLTNEAGKYAIESLIVASEALKAGKLDGLVTAPIHKKNIQSFTKKIYNRSNFLMQGIPLTLKNCLL